MEEEISHMQCSKKLLYGGLVATWFVFGGISARAQGMPEGEGKEAIEASCTLCHGLNYITRAGRTAAEWRNVVSDMVSRGAPLTIDEFDQVLRYLETHFGPGNATGSANSN